MWVFVVLVYGFLAGMVVNYFCDVLPVSRRLMNPVCFDCKHTYSWFEYITLSHCSECKKSRPIRSFSVQIIFPLIYLYLWFWPPARLNYIVGTLLLIYLFIVAIIDLEYRVVLHVVSIAGMMIGLSLGWWLHGIWTTFLGGAAGFGIMFALYYLGKVFAKLMSWIRHQDVEEVALGYGDVNLAGILGLILGWPGITVGLLFSILLGGIFSAGFIIYSKLSHRYQMFTAIPYAPFLIIGSIFLLFRP
jgi:prepilin signal peptidase PulO-like enzyme (type II secretory pathway)